MHDFSYRQVTGFPDLEASETRRIPRWLIETGVPVNIRMSVSEPFRESMSVERDLQRDNNRNARRMLRRSALDNGMAYAVLTAAYSSMEVEEIFATFEDTNFRNRQPSDERRTLINRADRPEDRRLLDELKKLLRLGRFTDSESANSSRDSFQAALNILYDINWIPEDTREEDLLLTTVRARTSANARAVFRSAEEQAQRIADRDYVDPARTDFITSTYGSKATTELLTAYLMVDYDNLEFE